MEGKKKKGNRPKRGSHDEGGAREPSQAQSSSHGASQGQGQNFPQRGGSSRGRRQEGGERGRGWEQGQGRQGQEGFEGRYTQGQGAAGGTSKVQSSSSQGHDQNFPAPSGESSGRWKQGREERERGGHQDRGQGRRGWRQDREGFERSGLEQYQDRGFQGQRGGSSRGWRQDRTEREREMEQDRGQGGKGWKQGRDRSGQDQDREFQGSDSGRYTQGQREEGGRRGRGRGFGRRDNIIEAGSASFHEKEEQAAAPYRKQQPREFEKREEKQKRDVHGDYDSEQKRSYGDYKNQDRRGRGRGGGRGAYSKHRETERSDQQGRRDSSWDNQRDQGDFYKTREPSRSDSVDSFQSGGKTDLKKREVVQPTSEKESTPVSVPQKTSRETSQEPSTSRQTPPGTSVGKSPGKVVSSYGFSIPHRKNIGSGVVGTRGKQIMIEVNHLTLELRKSSAEAFHYDVVIKPKLPKKLLRQVMREFQRCYSREKPFAFDGMKNVYSCGKLPFGEELCKTVMIFDEERQTEKECEVYIKCVSKVDMTSLMKFIQGVDSPKLPQEAIQCLDIVLRNPGSLHFTPVGRSFFSPPKDPIINLGDGLELWRGFYQSVNLGWKPYLNIDVAHKAFPRAINLIDFIMEMLRTNNPNDLNKPLGRRDVEDLERFVKGLKIEYSIPSNPQTKRTYKVNRVKKSAVEERFELKDNRIISVGEYFEKEKNHKLKFPHMPCLHVGNEEKKIYLPIELCTVVKGQSTNRKLNANQTSVMVKNAAEPSDIRRKRIMNAIQQAGFNNDPCVNDFGVNVSSQFAQVPARILNPPELKYADQNVSPIKGVWRAQKLLNTNPLESWVVLNLCYRVSDGSIRDFIHFLKQSGTNMGIRIENPHEVQQLNLRGRELDSLSDKFKTFLKKYEALQLIVVVIEETSYAAVKNAAELRVGVLTQCVKSRTMSKMNIATSSNILLKINAKLNGVNNAVIFPRRPNIFLKPVMIVGADVTHPSPGEEGVPSIAAVTSSFDPNAFKCKMSWRIQEPRQELIVDLKNIMKDHLMFFYQRNNTMKPEKIIYYRDGVGEGQFTQVLDVEFMAIRQACNEFPDYKPAITILIVQKRHHTRFFPLSRQHAEGRGNNVPAGTIVDTQITHPTEMDFYLVSHASLQGTARPTKYHKIWDDSNFDDDDLEELTFYLCHLFARCTRSVSYPAQTYYAHLAAFRARKAYVDGINIKNLQREQELRSINENIVQGNPMFYV